MAIDFAEAADKAKAINPAPALKGVHHSAFRCRDAEETRKFYEDILGLPLKAALVFEEEPGSGRPIPYMHLFFELGDGNYVAFFDVPEGAHSGKCGKMWPRQGLSPSCAVVAPALLSRCAPIWTLCLC